MPKNKIRYKKIKNMADKGHCYEGVRKSIISLYENTHLIFFILDFFVWQVTFYEHLDISQKQYIG